MTDKIRWGILGTASIAERRVIPAMQQSRNGEVVAVASRSLERAQAFAATMKLPKAYGSYEALINDPDVDAIYNPLPNSEHAVWSIKCAEAGKPVLCEKPLASDAAEAQMMVDAFVSRGVPFTEGFMYRFHPQTNRIKDILESGGIGQPNVISASFTFASRRPNDIRLDKSLAGGSLMDVGCYCVNLMRFMTGEEPISGQAIAEFGAQSGVEEKLVGLLAFPSGITGHFDCGLRSYRTHTYDIRGTEGRILAEKGFTMEANETHIIRWWHGDEYEEIQTPAVNQYTLMAEDFADALLNKRPPRFAPGDGVANMHVIDMLLAAAQS